MYAVSIWRWDTLMSHSVAVRGITRYDGSPHQGFRRSPSASNGESPLIEIPAVLTRLTVASCRGRRSGAHGTGSRGACLIRDFVIIVEAGLRYLKEFTWRGNCFMAFPPPGGRARSAS